MQQLTTKQKISKLNKQYQENLSNIVNNRCQELKNSPDVLRLQKEINHFLDNGNDNYYLDDMGMLNCVAEINLGELKTEHKAVIYDILDQLIDAGYWEYNQYSKQYEIHQCLGEAIIYQTEWYERNSYIIYSEELGLKLTNDDIKSKNHGWLLIEKAMRDSGVFPAIVQPYKYSNDVLLLTSPFSTLTDDEIADRLTEIEENEV